MKNTNMNANEIYKNVLSENDLGRVSGGGLAFAYPCLPLFPSVNGGGCSGVIITPVRKDSAAAKTNGIVIVP